MSDRRTCWRTSGRELARTAHGRNSWGGHSRGSAFGESRTARTQSGGSAARRFQYTSGNAGSDNRRGNATTMLIILRSNPRSTMRRTSRHGQTSPGENKRQRHFTRQRSAVREAKARFTRLSTPAGVSRNSQVGRREVRLATTLLKGMGYAQQERLGHSCLELGIGKNTGIVSLLNEYEPRLDSPEATCRWRNRRGECLPSCSP